MTSSSPSLAVGQGPTGPARKRRPWYRSLLIWIGVNTVVLAALLVPVELVFGTWLRPMGMSDLKRFSIPIGTTFDFDTTGLYPGGGPIRYSRDQWGLRGTHLTPKDIDVLTVGGSTTEQRYLDDAVTWQAVAQREMAQTGRRLTIGNAGVDGQSTIGHLFNFDFWFPTLPGLKPRIVLFYVGANDVLRRDSRASFDASVDATSWQVRSATFQLLRTVRNNWRAREVGVYHGRGRALTDNDFTSAGLLSSELRSAIGATLVSSFLDHVDSLRARTEAIGATPIFMTQTASAWNADPETPTRGLKDTISIHGATVNYADVSALHRDLNRRLVGYCAARHVTCFDLARDGDFGAADYYDYLHNTPAGAEKIGRYLANRLSELMSSVEAP